ncbi:MAG: nuclear transport factor 2 family protein [Bdellovibrionales bacterium]|nr:nuclear transport factor 2 family protein [Bdellovibrionales bacterium]
MFKFLLLSLLVTGQVWAKGSVMIEDVIQDYFQGYQLADVKLIQNAFHSETRLLSVDNGKLDVTEMKDWLKGLENRRLQGDIRKGKLKIESITTTDYAASVKLNIVFPAFEFTDYLSLLKIEEKWLIVGKIYHFKEL